jgi:hypothetical protein
VKSKPSNLIAGANRERITEQDRRLDLAELHELHQPRTLAEAVDHVGACPQLLPEQIAVMRQHRRETGQDIALMQAAVPDAHAGNIGDRIERPRQQRTAEQTAPCAVHLEPPHRFTGLRKNKKRT